MYIYGVSYNNIQLYTLVLCAYITSLSHTDDFEKQLGNESSKSNCDGDGDGVDNIYLPSVDDARSECEDDNIITFEGKFCNQRVDQLALQL